MKRIIIFVCSSIIPVVAMQLPELFTLKEKTVYTTKLREESIKKIVDLSSFPDQNEFISLEHEDVGKVRFRLRDVGNKQPKAGAVSDDILKVACTHNRTFAIIERPKNCFYTLIRVFTIDNQDKFLDKAMFKNFPIDSLSWNPEGSLLGCNEGPRRNEFYIIENKATKSSECPLVSDICIKNEYYLANMAWNNDGSKFVTGGKYYSETGKKTDDQCLIIHTLNSGNTETILNQTDIKPRVIKTSSKNHCVFMDSPCYADELGYFDIEHKQVSVLQSKETKKIKALCFDQTGSYLATGDQQGTIVIWDTQSQKVVCTHSTSKEINALAWSNDGKELIVGFDENTINTDILVGYTLNKIIKDKN